ncbi:beta-1,4-N-acetylgalactosaminyltransferase bre-4-like [Pecten maximus]|uniref:beta-1,4-N-acetylgalactosaminyltransferase bre-4-like n=1 Tax=Pecten maximus TaxID=6579 RepID=UPI001457EDF5|nr:beta-1,4-N-acetylgalactosaminyltransferase bre-4-like [Pecten maximus]
MQRTPRTKASHVNTTSSSQSTNPRRSSKPTTARDEHAHYVPRQIKTNATKPKCPLVPPYLRGKVTVDITEYDEKTLERNHRLVKRGGTYKPSTCRSRHKVAIIIPYRNRKRHLRILLNNLHPFLQRQQLDYRIFVIELAPDVDFNRALCMNIGFLEAKRYDYQCFIFHDVDLIPENDNNVYSCPENPRHMSVAIDKFGYELPYIGLFGGVTAMTMDQFEIVNGYSNKFFGWGGEDDDLYKRYIY